MNTVRIGERTAARWVRHLRTLNCSPATVYVRRESLDKLIRFLNSLDITDFRDVTSDHIEQWRHDMFSRGLAAATVSQRLCSSRLFFEWLVTQGKIFGNPAAKLQPHRIPKPLPRVPSVDQVRRILEQPDTSTVLGKRDRALLEVMYDAGLRVNEAAAMRIDDFDLRNGLLRVRGKGSKERMLPLGAISIKALRDYLDNARPALLKRRRATGHVWIGIRKEPMTRQAVMLRVTSCMRAAGLKGFSSHSLRRAAATHMLANGASPLAVQQFLGHATMRHVSRYLRVTISELKQVHAGSRPGS